MSWSTIILPFVLFELPLVQVFLFYLVPLILRLLYLNNFNLSIAFLNYFSEFSFSSVFSMVISSKKIFFIASVGFKFSLFWNFLKFYFMFKYSSSVNLYPKSCLFFSPLPFLRPAVSARGIPFGLPTGLFFCIFTILSTAIKIILLYILLLLLLLFFYVFCKCKDLKKVLHLLLKLTYIFKRVII